MLGKDKVILVKKRADLVGVLMLKDGVEKKIRAIRVVDKFQKRGYGLHIIDHALKVLDTNKPVASVAYELLDDYARIFINRYGFNITHVYNGLYRKHHLEY